jgi:predicted dehydrogenase
MDKIGVGVVGCGFVGHGAHVRAFSEIPEANLVAVADADPKRLETSAKKFSVPNAYKDYKDLIKNKDIKAVVVSVPTPYHAEVALAAIKAGKHIICEMPLARTMEDADAIIDAAKKAGVVVMPSLTFRFTPPYVKAKALIKEGKLGQVTCVAYREWIPAKVLAAQWPAGGWMWDLEKSGGPLYTLAVWSIDLFRWLVESEITRVETATKYTVLPQFGGTLGYDSCSAVKFANGVVGTFHYSGTASEAGAVNVLEVVGSSTAKLQANDNDILLLFEENRMPLIPFSKWNLLQPGARIWGHWQQDQHFLQCLQQGKQPCITPQDGRRAMEIALEIGKEK